MQDETTTKIYVNGYSMEKNGNISYNIQIQHQEQYCYVSKTFSQLQKYSKMLPKTTLKFPSDNTFFMFFTKINKFINHRIQKMNTYFSNLCQSSQLQQNITFKSLMRDARNGPQSIQLKVMRLKQKIQDSSMIISN